MLRGVIVKLAADRQLNSTKASSAIFDPYRAFFRRGPVAVIALDQEALRQGRPPSRALAAEMFRGAV